MLPVSFGNPDPAGIPNLIRRSVQGDASTIPSPAVASLASAVNSTTPSANGRFITLARWNKHYLVPKLNTGDNKTDPVASFVAPDWVILTQGDSNNPTTTPGGPVAFSAWDSTLADPTNAHYAVGRCAYAIYDEGSLLDANVVGYPSGSTPDQVGRKGSVAFADLTQLPYPITNSSSPYQVNALVGWRNYGVTGPNSNFPNSNFATNLQTSGSSTTSPAYLYWQSILNRTAGFTTTSGAVTNGRTDQQFLSRQQLIAYWATPNADNGGNPIANTTQFNVNALQYLGTFLRELNAPSWKPSKPSGSSIDYAALAGNATAINRDLLTMYVPGSPTTAAFTRPDGTTAFGGDLLIKRRFPLSRINGLGPTGPITTDSNGNPIYSTINNGFLVQATAPNNGAGGTIQRDFGLQWDGPGGTGSTNYRWNYVGYTGTTVLSTIDTLQTVANENREPNFFELLKAGILSGSVGMGSGSGGSTFVAPEQKYYISGTAAFDGTTSSNMLSTDYQIFQIGANIINQWNSGNIPIFCNFGGNELAGMKNLPYLNKLVFKPAWIKVSPGNKDQFAAWLLPSLWNPHQNALGAGNVRIAMTAGTMTAILTDTGSPSSLTTTTPVVGSSSQYMTVDVSKFATPTSPSAPPAGSVSSPPGNITQSPDGYWGFHFPFATTAGVTPGNSSTAYPDFGSAECDFELQVLVGATWKTYQRWKIPGSVPNHPLIFQPPASSWTLSTLQDPEFVTLDPRTLRFGVWGNAANQSGAAADYTTGVLTTLETPAGVYETIPTAITALRPNGSKFASATSANLYLYANNVDSTVHYTDLDTLQRRGDIISGTTTAMLPTDVADRPQILNRPFQSVAELGQVFRDQPWKTLDFTTASSPDVGLLDVFTLHESGSDAGKTSLNTRYKSVLKAILSNATTRLTDPTGATLINSAPGDPLDAIVNALYNITSANPMIRKTELLTNASFNNTVNTALGGNKEARELVMRAFSDACQTRTWNLLIDVIAQSGRYPPNANSLIGFVVEGEQHYWVHVAIDRFTGQVIDKQIEVVNE